MCVGGGGGGGGGGGVNAKGNGNEHRHLLVDRIWYWEINGADHHPREM